MSDLDDEIARAEKNLGGPSVTDIHDDAPSPRQEPRKRSRFRKPGWRLLGALFLIGVIFAAAHYSVVGLRTMAFFRVRTIEIRGTRYLQPNEIVQRLQVDTLRSLWDDVGPLEARIRNHPQVSDVHVTRRMPGTLVVTLRENLPVALISTPNGLAPYDSLGRELPIDPLRTDLDLPVTANRDPAILRLLGSIRATDPALFQRVSEVRRTGRDEVLLLLSSAYSVPSAAGDTTARPTGVLHVRAPVGVSAERLTDIFPVESDLAARQARIGELDLRFRDQVIARIQ